MNISPRRPYEVSLFIFFFLHFHCLGHLIGLFLIWELTLLFRQPMLGVKLVVGIRNWIGIFDRVAVYREWRCHLRSIDRSRCPSLINLFGRVVVIFLVGVNFRSDSVYFTGVVGFLCLLLRAAGLLLSLLLGRLRLIRLI